MSIWYSDFVHFVVCTPWKLSSVCSIFLYFVRVKYFIKWQWWHSVWKNLMYSDSSDLMIECDFNIKHCENRKTLEFVTSWVLSHFEFLSFVTMWVFEFCHNLSFRVLSQFEFLSLITIWVFKFHHKLGFWVLSQFEILRFITIWVWVWVFLWNFFSCWKKFTKKNCEKSFFGHYCQYCHNIRFVTFNFFLSFFSQF